MKKLIKILSILIFCIIQNNALADDDYKEYVIALVLPKEYAAQAQVMNQEVVTQVPLIATLPNIFHITLYQGRFSKNEIEGIYQKLAYQNFPRIRINLEPKIKITESRFINWQVKKSAELQEIHNVVVSIASLYHHGILSRYLDSYNGLSGKQQQQVDKYGMYGLLDEYDPHVTIFYFPQKNPQIQNIARKVNPPKSNEEFHGVPAGSIVIGEIGYSGNIEQGLYEIRLR